MINYPNPFTERSTVFLPRVADANSILVLYSSTGQEIRRIPVPVGDVRVIINRDGLTGGMYLYRLLSNGLLSESGSLIIE